MASVDLRPETSPTGGPWAWTVAKRSVLGGGEAAPAAQEFRPTINRLRGYALLLVVLYHAGGFLDLPNLLHGEAGVDIFLLISGYVLAVSSVEISTAHFLRRRFFRIFPAYWSALLLFVVLQLLFLPVPCTGLDIFLHFTGLHSFFRTRYMFGINDSFWFVSLIIFLYGLFLAVRRRLDDLDFVARVGVLAAAAMALYLNLAGHYVGATYMPARVPDFFLGLVAGQLAAGRGLRWRPSAVLAAALLLLAYATAVYSINYEDLLRGSLYLGLFVCAEGWLAKGSLGKMALAALGFLGTYSYELYLLHQPLIGPYCRLVLLKAFGIAAPSRLQLTAGMAVGFGVACAAALLLRALTGLLARGFRSAAGARSST